MPFAVHKKDLSHSLQTARLAESCASHEGYRVARRGVERVRPPLSLRGFQYWDSVIVFRVPLKRSSARWPHHRCSYPYCRTILTSPYLDKLVIKIETHHRPGNGEVANVHGLVVGDYFFIYFFPPVSHVCRCAIGQTSRQESGRTHRHSGSSRSCQVSRRATFI
jgi:hypothetical protein